MNIKMVQTMSIKIMYVTADGTHFDSQEDAQRYQDIINDVDKALISNIGRQFSPKEISFITERLLEQFDIIPKKKVTD